VFDAGGQPVQDQREPALEGRVDVGEVLGLPHDPLQERVPAGVDELPDAWGHAGAPLLLGQAGAAAGLLLGQLGLHEPDHEGVDGGDHVEHAVDVEAEPVEGVMDRFRSMPIARSAVPFGRTAADLLGAAVGVAIMALIALLVGWRAHNGLAATLGAFGLVLLLRYAVSWIGTWVGLSVTPQTADSLVPLVFPVTMISNSFVPTTGMPAWLRLIADWNPISALVAACRELFGNPTVLAAHAAFPCGIPWPRRSAGRCSSC